MSRQNPHYPADASMRDALALVTAQLHGDDALVNDALRNALDGTDHTMLAHELGMLAALTITQLGAALGQAPTDVLQRLAVTIADVVEGEHDE